MKTNKELLKSLIARIDELEDNHFLSGESSAKFIEDKIGNYDINYVLFYTKNTSNYISAGYLTPEEATINYTIDEIDELCVYLNGNLIEFSDVQYDQLTEEILTHLKK